MFLPLVPHTIFFFIVGLLTLSLFKRFLPLEGGRFAALFVMITYSLFAAVSNLLLPGVWDPGAGAIVQPLLLIILPFLLVFFHFKTNSFEKKFSAANGILLSQVGVLIFSMILPQLLLTVGTLQYPISSEYKLGEQGKNNIAFAQFVAENIHTDCQTLVQEEENPQAVPSIDQCRMVKASLHNTPVYCMGAGHEVTVDFPSEGNSVFACLREFKIKHPAYLDCEAVSKELYFDECVARKAESLSQDLKPTMEDVQEAAEFVKSFR